MQTAWSVIRTMLLGVACLTLALVARAWFEAGMGPACIAPTVLSLAAGIGAIASMIAWFSAEPDFR